MNGTVAPVLGNRLDATGWGVVPWDRSAVSPDDAPKCRHFIDDVNPSVIAHLAMGAPDWAGLMAEEAAGRGIPFLFTSTVSVYADRTVGPITVDSPTDSTSEYGRYKIDCEERTRRSYPDAIIARLGWQIGDAPGSNTMVHHLYDVAGHVGTVEASTRWFPACSFLGDTAAVLHGLIERSVGGTYLVDSNRRSSFFEIVSALNRIHGHPWRVEPIDEPILDMRMVDERIDAPPLTTRLQV